LRKDQVVTVLLAVFVTLLALAPVGYTAYRSLPPRIATVDLQKLVEEESKRTYEIVIAKGGNVTDEQRAMVEKLTVEFAKRLSSVVDGLGLECRCVIVNKAALLAGVTVDYTDAVRERMKR